MMAGGVPRDEATAKDFMQVRAALVRRLGGANEALVWTRIDWRADSARVAHQTQDGTHWWAATYPEIADETGLSADQVRRAVDRLVEGGFLRAEQQHGFARKRSYAPIYSHVANLPAGEDARSKRQDRQIELADMPDGSSLIETEDKNETTSSVASDSDGDYRSEVYHLCNVLAEAVKANGHRVGEVGVRWWSACDRLLRIDGYTVEQIDWMIRWSTSNEFWAANIRSMPTLRDKFSTMVLQAKRDGKNAPMQRARDVLDLGRQMAAERAAS